MKTEREEQHETRKAYKDTDKLRITTKPDQHNTWNKKQRKHNRTQNTHTTHKKPHTQLKLKLKPNNKT